MCIQKPELKMFTITFCECVYCLSQWKSHKGLVSTSMSHSWRPPSHSFFGMSHSVACREVGSSVSGENTVSFIKLGLRKVFLSEDDVYGRDARCVRCSSAGCPPPSKCPPGQSVLVQMSPRTVCPRAERSLLMQNAPPPMGG